MSPWLTVIGVGEAGLSELPHAARQQIAAASNIVGPERFLLQLRPAEPLSRSLSSSGHGDSGTDGAPTLPSPLRGGVGGGGFRGADPTDEQPGFANYHNARHIRGAKHTSLARKMRHEQTPPELAMWTILRQFADHRFRRQVPIGKYIADFACHDPKLVIEVDGDTHAHAELHDSERTIFLESVGYQVLRIANSEAVSNADGVWEIIQLALNALETPSLSLPSRGRGGGGSDDATAPSSIVRVEGGESQNLIPWQPGLDAMLAQVIALRGAPTVILASGDPGWFGIGATLARHLDHREYTLVPHPSAFQLAAARLHWPLQNVAAISLHGRQAELIHPHILPANRILALTSDASTARRVAEILIARGYGQSLLTALENLGGDDERLTAATAARFDAGAIGDFYVLAVDCVAYPGARLLPPLPGLPDDAFVSDGQLTKREVRAAALARLAPYPDALLWDVGAGCGSIAIEWMRSARNARAIAFEAEAGRAEIIARNAAALGVPELAVVLGEAPASLAGQPTPDAVFLGGDAGNDALFAACWEALRPGGRFVADAVTIEGERALLRRHATLGGELVRIAIEVLDRIGGSNVLRPRLPVLQWFAVKPDTRP